MLLCVCGGCAPFLTFYLPLWLPLQVQNATVYKLFTDRQREDDREGSREEWGRESVINTKRREEGESMRGMERMETWRDGSMMHVHDAL